MNTEHYLPQIERIKEKLNRARSSDKKLRVFGADAHRYQLAPPVSEEALCKLERNLNIELPEDYRAFLLHVGNGIYYPKGVCHGGAGPYYGLQSVMRSVKFPNISYDAILRPDMSDQEWEELYDASETDDLNYDQLTNGCAYIVSQDCSFSNLLVLNGPFKGRIVYFVDDGAKPWFAFEKNFLDWYERWLDEVIAGYLTKGGAAWFGMTMGGDAKALLDLYDKSTDPREKADALTGLSKLIELDSSSIERLVTIASKAEGKLKELAVRALVEFNPEASRPFLKALIEDEGTDIQALCQSISANAGHLANEFVDSFVERLEKSKTHGDFFSIVSLLKENHPNFAVFLEPFFQHKDPLFRGTAIYVLGHSKNRNDYTHTFVEALRDTDACVVRNALQATKGMNSAEILAEFPRLHEKCQKNPAWCREGYIKENLRKRETEVVGLASRVLNWLRGKKTSEPNT